MTQQYPTIETTIPELEAMLAYLKAQREEIRLRKAITPTIVFINTTEKIEHSNGISIDNYHII